VHWVTIVLSATQPHSNYNEGGRSVKCRVSLKGGVSQENWEGFALQDCFPTFVLNLLKDPILTGITNCITIILIGENMAENKFIRPPDKSIGRPPIEGEALTSTLPVVRCSEEMAERIEYIANYLGVNVSELVRAYVDYCTLWNPHPSAKSLVKASRKTTHRRWDE